MEALGFVDSELSFVDDSVHADDLFYTSALEPPGPFCASPRKFSEATSQETPTQSSPSSLRKSGRTLHISSSGFSQLAGSSNQPSFAQSLPSSASASAFAPTSSASTSASTSSLTLSSAGAAVSSSAAPSSAAASGAPASGASASSASSASRPPSRQRGTRASQAKRKLDLSEAGPASSAPAAPLSSAANTAATSAPGRPRKVAKVEKEEEEEEDEEDEEEGDGDGDGDKKSPGKRCDASLSLLASKFVELLNGCSTRVLDLNEAAKILNAKKRRIYDITNVLEGVGFIEKKNKNHVIWKGYGAEESEEQKEKRLELMQKLDDLDKEKEMLDEVEVALRSHLDGVIESCQAEKLCYVMHKDVSETESFKDSTLISIRAPQGTELKVPDPDDAKSQHRRYQILLASPNGPIHVSMVNVDDSKLHSPPRRSATTAERRSTVISVGADVLHGALGGVMSSPASFGGLVDVDVTSTSGLSHVRSSAGSLEWQSMFSGGTGADTLESLAFSIDHLSAGPSDILDEIEKYTNVFSDPRALALGALSASGVVGGVGGVPCSLDDAVGMDAGSSVDLTSDETYFTALHSWEGINDMFSATDLTWPAAAPPLP